MKIKPAYNNTLTTFSAAPTPHGNDQNSPMNPNHLMEMQHRLNLQENQYLQFLLQKAALEALANLEFLASEPAIPYEMSCDNTYKYRKI